MSEMIIKDTGADFEREIPTAGPINAVCFKVFNIGAQMTKFGVKQEVCIVWEVDFRYKTGELKGKRFMLKQRYTANLGERSNLRKMLESWRGRPFDPTELKIKGFDLKKVEGRPAQLNIVHKIDGENTYANLGQRVEVQTDGSKKIWEPVTKLPEGTTPMTVEAPADFIPKYVQTLIEKQVASEMSSEDTVLAEKGFNGEVPPQREPTEEEKDIF